MSSERITALSNLLTKVACWLILNELPRHFPFTNLVFHAYYSLGRSPNHMILHLQYCYHSKLPGISSFLLPSILFAAHCLSSHSTQHSFQTLSSSLYRSITHGLQLLPQQSPGAGFSGFSSRVALAINSSSLIGARRGRSLRSVGDRAFGSKLILSWCQTRVDHTNTRTKCSSFLLRCCKFGAELQCR